MRGFLIRNKTGSRGIYAGASGAVFLVILLGITGCSRPTTFPSPGEADQRIAEITSVQADFRSPVPDRLGKYLAYVRAVGPGRRLFIYDLTTGHPRVIATSNEVSQVFGWSADDRFLAFAQAPPLPPRPDDAQTAAWLTLYDFQNGACQRLGTNIEVQESSGTWLAGHKLFYSAHQLGSNYTEKFIVDLDAQTTLKARNFLSDFVLVGTNQAVFFRDGNLESCALDTTNYPVIRPVTHFPPQRFDMFRWLQYRAETGTFLFCARQSESQWRCLYEFDPATGKLEQLTTGNTYNGQCLGRGFAYVGGTNNEFFLALRPADARLSADLFLGGNVVTYAASADGSHIYAIASEKTEPTSLWVYNVAQRKLRKLAPGQPGTWRHARLIEPQPHLTPSFDGLEIPYFVLPPAELVRNPISQKKFPVMLYLPPATWQFQSSFNLPAEMYANLNYWFLAVNYRGADGYGRAFSDKQNVPNAARDALVALAELGANTNVDLQHVTLLGESSGADVALELLKNSANVWRGVILQHPEDGALQTSSVSADSPPLFIVAGDLERSRNGLNEFEAFAKKLGISEELYLQKDTGHEVWSTDRVREAMQAEWKFIQQWMQ